MKNIKTKLTLNRETVRRLVHHELRLAAGGQPIGTDGVGCTVPTALANGCGVGSYGTCGEESECW